MSSTSRRIPLPGSRQLITAWRLIQSRDLTSLTRRTFNFLRQLAIRKATIEYGEWRERWVVLKEDDFTQIDLLLAALPHRPSFTIIVRCEEAHPEQIRSTLSSISSQRYPDWLVCLTGMGSASQATISVVDSIRDNRIRFTGPSPQVFGEWVAHLRAGDVLGEAALFAVANSIAHHPAAAVIYTDNDHTNPRNQFYDPHMKPDWNPDLLDGVDYLEILTVYRSNLWNAHAEPATDAHGLALRATRRLRSHQILHLPYVLASRWVPDRQSHLVPATVRVRYQLPKPSPKVSVLIPTRDQGRMLERCLSSLHDITDYPNIELVIIDHETTEARALTVLDGLVGAQNTQKITHSGPFNFAAMMNRAAAAATGEVLLLLNNDTEVISPIWLTELVSQVSRPEVGIAGAVLLFADRTIQHAGVHPGLNGLMGHGHKHLPSNSPGYFGRLLVTHEVAAVTGACLAIESSTWNELGGLDEESLAVAYNDIDLCLRARAAGLRIVLVPSARLIHHESTSRGVDDDPTRNDRLAGELAVMLDRWGGLLHADPAYSPNLSLTHPDFQLSEHPRTSPPWRD